jgi:RNA polymerase sigma-54 factor
MRSVLTPAFKQSQRILALSASELESTIDHELQNNPLLEITAPAVASKTTSLKNDDPTFEIPVEQPWTLKDHLHQQLSIAFDDESLYQMGEAILAGLNEDGFFKDNLDELAKSNNMPLRICRQVLTRIQQFDPPGIAARSLQECLLLQIAHSDSRWKDLATLMIRDHFSTLSKHRFSLLARRLNISNSTLKEVIEFVHTFNPRPAQSFSTSDHAYHLKPDIHVVELANGDLQIVLHDSELPTLGINATYRSYLRRSNLSAEEQTYIRNHIKNAQLFLEGLRQRQQTLMDVARFIVNKQSRFIKGTTSGLEPLILNEIAESLHRDIATISRATKNKIIATPVGLFPLKSFFSSPVKHQSGSDTSQHAVCELIRSLIDNEDKTHPLSDQSIQRLLQDKGVIISRRTVTKYRMRLKFLPSTLRKSLPQ